MSQSSIHVAIGCDGVLADLRTAVAGVASAVAGLPYAASGLPADFALGSESTAKHLKELGLSEQHTAAVLATITGHRGFVAGLVPYMGTRSALQALRAVGAIVSCWAPTWQDLPMGEEERLSWLALHLGIDVVHLTHDAALVDADMFVDCRVETVMAWSRRHRWGEAMLWAPERTWQALTTRVMNAYPADIVRRSKLMGVHPEHLMPHEGSAACDVCGCDPGEQHHLATHAASADLLGSLYGDGDPP